MKYTDLKSYNTDIQQRVEVTVEQGYNRGTVKRQTILPTSGEKRVYFVQSS